jgi:hypothetical protein
MLCHKKSIWIKSKIGSRPFPRGGDKNDTLCKKMSLYDEKCMKMTKMNKNDISGFAITWK